MLVSLSVDLWTEVTADKSTFTCGVVFAQWSKISSWLQVVFYLTVEISLGECE